EPLSVRVRRDGDAYERDRGGRRKPGDAAGGQDEQQRQEIHRVTHPELLEPVDVVEERRDRDEQRGGPHRDRLARPRGAERDEKGRAREGERDTEPRRMDPREGRLELRREREEAV